MHPRHLCVVGSHRRTIRGARRSPIVHVKCTANYIISKGRAGRADSLLANFTHRLQQIYFCSRTGYSSTCVPPTALILMLVEAATTIRREKTTVVPSHNGAQISNHPVNAQFYQQNERKLPMLTVRLRFALNVRS